MRELQVALREEIETLPAYENVSTWKAVRAERTKIASLTDPCARAFVSAYYNI